MLLSASDILEEGIMSPVETKKLEVPENYENETFKNDAQPETESETKDSNDKKPVEDDTENNKTSEVQNSENET